MNKKEITAVVAANTGLSPFKVAAVFAALEQGVKVTLKKGGSVSLGFMSFSLAKQAARTVRNPRNGNPIHVPAKKKPVAKIRESFKVLFN